VALAQLDGLVPKLFVREFAKIVFEVIDSLCIVLQSTQKTTFTDAKCAFENVSHGSLLLVGLSRLEGSPNGSGDTET